MEFDSPIQQTFVGRQNELDILRRELVAGESRAACIAGLGGVGKAALAWVFADLHKPAFPGGSLSFSCDPARAA